MPRILGTGLVALDLIVEHHGSHQEIRAGGGGTCGNVLAILATAGWQSRLLGALDESVWSQILLKDLESAGVLTEDLVRAPDAFPSLIVEHLDRTTEGGGKHWFSFICPRCSSDWPGLRAAPDAAVRKGAPYTDVQDVIFVDRLSEGVMELARKASASGSFIAYEPSSRHDRPWMSEMLNMADFVKFSSEREQALAVELGEIKAKLVVRTDGDRGASWRIGGRSGDWFHRPAHRSTAIVDTCGAGDWFTAGMLLALFESPYGRNEGFSAPTVAFAIERASALAAWSCGFVGARGALYDAASAELTRQIGVVPQAVWKQGGSWLSRPTLPEEDCRSLASICSA